MRNLMLQRASWLKDETIKGARNVCADPDTNTLYLICADKSLVAVDFETKDVSLLCPDIYPASSGWQEVVAFDYVVESRHLCIVFASGELINVDADTGTSDCVGMVSSGLDAAAWSSDQEHLVLATKAGTMILMRQGYDAVQEKDLNPAEFGSGKAVNVGWGSKETQFHGSEGKAAAKAKSEQIKEAFVWDDRRPRITWRTDGQLFAISTVDPSKNCRVIRIWNQEAELQYTSELVPGLEQSLIWRTNGPLIASSRQHFTKHEVVFFEKNGLAHGSFALPFSEGTFFISQISWSVDGKILLVSGVHEEFTYVLLYTTGNYHWYLKQALRFSNETQRLLTTLWDQRNSAGLHLLFENGHCAFYNFTWTTNGSTDSQIGVVDGNSLLITPFNFCIIPPPMCALQYNFENFINEVAFDSSTKQFIVKLIDGKAFIVKLGQQQTDTLTDFKVQIHTGGLLKSSECFPVECSAIQLPPTRSIAHLILREKTIFYIDYEDNSSSLYAATINEEPKLIHTFQLHVLAFGSHDNQAAILLKDGSVKRFNLQTNAVEDWIANGKPLVIHNNCQEFFLAPISEKEVEVFLLTKNGTLYLNEKIILKNCTSFQILNKFLIFTTSESILDCWRLENLHQNNPLIDDSTKRPIENGSRLVTCTKSGAVLVQTPRGNLETVYPRPLLWNAVESELDNGRFLAAFEIMRKNRMNTNLLCDRNYDNFFEVLPEFLKQLGSHNIQYINLFISDLNGECHRPPGVVEAKAQKKLDNKVTLICKRIRETLEEAEDKSRYLQPILATLAKEGNVGEALIRINALSDIATRDAALKFLLYMIDVNALCDEALGTYNMSIVLMVSEKSQRDPREYSQFLAEIESYKPELYRRYKIDVHLKRYRKALEHIAQSDSEEHFAECLSLIEQHRLYREALHVFDHEDRKRTVYVKFGEYLLAKRYYDEAGLAFMRGADFGGAIKSYQLAGNWNAAIRACLKLNNSDQLQSLSQSLIENLCLQGKHADAASISKEFLNDEPRALRLLIEGREWDHCLRWLPRVNDEPLRAEFLRKLLDHCESTMTVIEDLSSKLERYVRRLLLIRQEKANRAKEMFEYDLAGGDDESAYSVAVTGSVGGGSGPKSSKSPGSIGTRRSAKSSKKVRAYSMKEGSTFEDLAIITACRDIIQKLNDLQPECGLLIRTLCEFELEETKAQPLQRRFDELLKLADRSADQIWAVDSNAEKTTEDIVASSGGGELISDPSLRLRPALKKSNWRHLFAD